MKEGVDCIAHLQQDFPKDLSHISLGPGPGPPTSSSEIRWRVGASSTSSMAASDMVRLLLVPGMLGGGQTTVGCQLLDTWG